MARQPGAEHQLLRFVARRADCERQEVAMKSRVDGERAGRRVHAGDVLDVLDLLRYQFDSIVPFFKFQKVIKRLNSSSRLT